MTRSSTWLRELCAMLAALWYLLLLPFIRLFLRYGLLTPLRFLLRYLLGPLLRLFFLNLLRPLLGRFLRLIRRCTSWNGFWWIAGIAVVLAIGIYLSWRFWEDLQGGAESLSATIRNLGLVIGGVIAILLAVWRSVVGSSQADTAQRGLLNERYQKGAEMLGSNVQSVRLGGIYALQQLAEEHPEHYHIQVMRLLCAFVRNPTKDKETDLNQAEPEVKALREDIHAGMIAISVCHTGQLSLELDAGYILDFEDANLSWIVFQGRNLSRAKLINANLFQSVLNRTDLSGSNLFLAYLRHADLSDANLANVTMSRTLTRGVKLWGANMSGAALDGLDLSGVRLNQAILFRAVCNKVNFDSAHLDGADFSGAMFTSSIFTNAQFSHAKLSRASVQGQNLRGANLSRAELSATDLINADLTECTLDWAKLSGAHLQGANLSNATLVGADLSGTSLSADGWLPVNGLTQAQLDQARSDPKILPI